MSVKPSHTANTTTEGGFALLEVLIAVVVLSFGLLGLAALQVTAIKNNHSAHQRAQATVLAYDITDRMRANRDEALSGSYNTAFSDAAPSGTSMRDLDLAAWKTSLAARLPDGLGAINADAATGIVTVTLQWNDSRGTNGNASQQWSTQTQL
jgi:type IV pilus assembly protein PilV